jgi:hypothetical protein
LQIKRLFRCRTMSSLAALSAGLCIAPYGLAQQPDSSVRMNQIQVIGTHNSYHAGLTDGMTKLLEQTRPKAARSLDYRHAAIDAQLSAGVRQIELDIYADTEGGRYAHPIGPELIKQTGIPADPDLDPKGLMLKPGFKVMHTQDIDQRSSCQPFTACLEIVRAWSRRNPNHLPVFILVETKQGKALPEPHSVTPEPFTAATFDALDSEIRSVFAPNELITPDVVRGVHGTLNEAILAGEWPTLGQARGKVVFLMDQRNVGPVYLAGHPSLRGRVLFTNAAPGQPDAAFTEENEGSEQTINALVRQGYLVRTRTDADTEEGRSGNTARRDAALESGAQLLSTDYPASEPAKWTGYFVSFPGGLIARCNPVLKAAGGADAGLAMVPSTGRAK